MTSRSPLSPNVADSGPRDWRLTSVCSDEPPQRMIARPAARRASAPARRSGSSERIAGFANSSSPRGVDDRHRVLELFDRRLEVRDLAGHLRSIGRQLFADGVEERAELAELVVLVEVQLHAELAAPQARQTAADHVNRPEQQLREQHRDQHRDGQRRQRRRERGPQRPFRSSPNQQRRHADADRSDLACRRAAAAAGTRGSVPGSSRSPAAATTTGAPAACRDRRRRQRLPFERPIGVRRPRRR